MLNKKWHEIHDWLLEGYDWRIIHYEGNLTSMSHQQGGDKTKLKLLKDQILDIEEHTAHYIPNLPDEVCLFKSFTGINWVYYVITLGGNGVQFTLK